MAKFKDDVVQFRTGNQKEKRDQQLTSEFTVIKNNKNG